MKTFIIDGMLGSLTRWLRITGYDSVYYRDKDDQDLIQEADESQRILLTRDKSLAQRATKYGVSAILVCSEDIQEQLLQVKNDLDLKLQPLISRCPVCNGVLFPRTKHEVKEIVPESSLNTFDEFWGCETCGKVYWKGTHWEKIIETLEGI